MSGLSEQNAVPGNPLRGGKTGEPESTYAETLVSKVGSSGRNGEPISRLGSTMSSFKVFLENKVSCSSNNLKYNSLDRFSGSPRRLRVWSPDLTFAEFS